MANTVLSDRQAQVLRTEQADKDSVRLHAFYHGKMETVPKCRIRSFDDFSVWYTPYVAGPCRAIQNDPEQVYELTSKGNTIAIVSDGTRVLGLGDIGPSAGLPVMEAKAMLFKYLGGVDAVPIVLDTKDPAQIIQTVKWLQPTFGGINLEDIAQPKCFSILDTLRAEMSIPVFHDDQQGTATVTVAGLLNALKVVGKRPKDVRVAFIGSGAANVACSRLAFAAGIPPEQCIVVDSKGILHHGRKDVEERRQEYADKWRICLTTNAEQRAGNIEDALVGMDACVALSTCGPDTIRKEWVRKMARDPIVFACANPTPEIWPWDAREAGAAVVATGRSDFPNQVNNSLVFPGLFRGALDVRARTISDTMCLAAANALASAVGKRLSPECILPTMDEQDVFVDQAVAVGLAAQAEGLARVKMTRDQLFLHARAMIRRSHEMVQDHMDKGFIPTSE